MFKDTLELEANLMASGKMKQRVETYKRKFRDAMLEVMMRNMERLMEKLALDNRPQNMDQPESQIIKTNFRTPAPTQINQRDRTNQINVEDQ